MSQSKFLVSANTGGYTLLEITVALFLGSIITLSLITFYSRCLNFFYYARNLSEEIENGRYACFYLQEKLRKAISIKSINGNNAAMQQLAVKPSSDAFEMTASDRVKVKFFISRVSFQNGKSYNALFTKEGRNPRVEIAAGIANMRIIYGIKCPISNNVCRYLLAENVTRWAEVLSIEVTLETEKMAKIWNVYAAIKRQ